MADEHVSIKDYVDRVLHERAGALDDRLRAVDARLEQMNEVREQLVEQNAQFISEIAKYLRRDEYDARHEALRTEVRRIETLTQGKVGSDVAAALEARVRIFERWQSNVNGRLWAIAGALAIIQFILSYLRAKVGTG